MIINKILKSCIHLFLVNLLLNYKVFRLKIFFTKILILNFHILSYGLLTKDSKLLEIEDKINITLQIWLKCKI